MTEIKTQKTKDRWKGKGCVILTKDPLRGVQIKSRFLVVVPQYIKGVYICPAMVEREE